MGLFSLLTDCIASFALISSLEPSDARVARPIPSRLQIRLEHQLRHHRFPTLTAKAVPVLRFRTLPVPGDDGHDRRGCAAHTGGRLITAGKLSYDRAVAVQQLPPIRSYSHLQRIAGRARGNGAVYGMTRASVPRVAQKDVPQAEPPIAAGEFRQWRPGAITRPAISCLTAATSPLTRLRPSERLRQLAPTQSAKDTPCPPSIELGPPWPWRAAIIVSVYLLHAALIPIYWNLAWPVRPPLPINPGVNASAHRFGGFGLKETVWG